MNNDALVEEVARALCKADGYPEEYFRDYIPLVPAALAIIRPAVIEECAKAAEGFPKNREWVPGSLYETLRRETAAAIRALKGDRDG